MCPPLLPEAKLRPWKITGWHCSATTPVATATRVRAGRGRAAVHVAHAGQPLVGGHRAAKQVALKMLAPQRQQGVALLAALAAFWPWWWPVHRAPTWAPVVVLAACVGGSPVSTASPGPARSRSR